MPDVRAQLCGYIDTLYYDEHLSPIVPQALGRGYVRFEAPEAAVHPGYPAFASNDIQTPQINMRGGAPSFVQGAIVVTSLQPGRILGVVPALPWMQPPQPYAGTR
jgi:hypothetical protein